MRKPSDIQPIPKATVESENIQHQLRRRVVSVRCPFCGGLHAHDLPLNEATLGVVKAPCRDLLSETAVQTAGLLTLLEYAASGTNAYQVKVGKGFRSDCEHIRKKVK